MSKYKIIAIYGKSGSGKDYTLNRLAQIYPDMIRIVSDTTRPKRDKEIDGLDYNFLTLEEFDKKEHLEISSYNGEFYGTPLDVFKKNKIHIGVFDLTGMKNILENNKLEVLPVYMVTPDKVRMLRCLQRELSPDVSAICKRFLADNEEYIMHQSIFPNMIACTDVEDLVTIEEFKNFL